MSKRQSSALLQPVSKPMEDFFMRQPAITFGRVVTLPDFGRENFDVLEIAVDCLLGELVGGTMDLGGEMLEPLFDRRGEMKGHEVTLCGLASLRQRSSKSYILGFAVA